MTEQGLQEQLLEALPDAVFVVAADGHIVFVNAQAVALFGYEREQLVGERIEKLVPEAARSVHPSHRSRYFAAPQVRPMGAGLDLAGRRADGTEFPCEISLSAIESPEGRLVTAVVRDVTERMRTQARFQGLLEAAPDAMVGVDSHGRIRLVNTQTEKLFGYDRSELLGQSIEILVPPRAREVHPRHRQRYFADPQVRPMGAGNELHAVRKDGTEFPAEISLSSIETDEGILVTGAVRDVSERKAIEAMVERARDTAERAARARQDFLANMSHEIRTPMNAVIGITSLLLDTPLDAQQRDYVETVRSSGDHLLTIISDILDYAKIDSGKIDLESVEFRLLDWVEDTLDLVGPQATDKGLELVVDVDPDCPLVVRGDPGRLRQVLINVVSNALKFTPEGEVVVRVDAEPPRDGVTTVNVAVRDTGIGISPERLAVLFDPFTQADSTTTREYGGTGLGLAICRRLTELMGGGIDLESAPGEGTTARFRFQAPVVTPAEPRREPVTDQDLLVVDDNATSREVLASWARRYGFRVTTAAAADEALEVAGHLTPGFAALVDHTLPGTDGMRLGRRLRDRFPSARLVLLSPAALNPTNLSSGVYDAVVARPVKRSHVQNVLLELLERGGRPSPAASGSRSSQFDLRHRAALSILVVEDNPVNQKVARHMLARFGYRTDVAWSGPEALEMLARRSYDLVLMDVQMPEMDGLETTRRIRARYPNQGPRVVAMTANVSRASISSCLAAGMDGFLGKPVSVTELAALLEDLGQERVRVPAAAAADGGEAVDKRVLDRLGEEIGQGTVQELVAMFRDDVARSVGQLTSAAEAGDHHQVAGLAHRLRSASRTLGAEHLAQMLGSLEDDPPPDGALPRLVDAVVEELQLVVRELEALASQA